MATDTTTFTPDTTATDHETPFDAVQLAQADIPAQPVKVQIPEGAKLVRVPVTPGEIIELPFGADAHLAGKLDAKTGNLAIKVGDVTVILEGYAAAEGQAGTNGIHDVVIETAEGKPIVLADVLTAGEGLDIQTAAGGDAVGAQGADNTGAIFSAFGAGDGIGGFNAVGAQDGTELQYVVINAEQKLFLQGDQAPDTHPTPTNTPGEVDEDGTRHLCENPFDDCYGGINTDPNQPGDEDRSYKETVKIVDYGPDGPAAVDPLVGDPGDGFCRDTDGNQVYSHGQEVLLKTGPDGQLIGYVKSDCCEESEVPVEFAKLSSEEICYNQEEGCYERIVFTATPVAGGATGEVCFVLKGPLDHPFNTDPDAEPVYTATLADAEGDGTSGDGDACCDPYAKWTEFEDNIKLDLLFQAKDSDDVSTTPIPFVVDVDDDSPAFLDCEFDPEVGYTMIADETHGVQCGTDDVDVTECFLTAIAGQQVEPGEHTIYDKFVQFFGCEAVKELDICDITAAQTHLKFGYGADGPLVHEICCGGDGNTGGDNTGLRTQGEGYGYGDLHGGDCVINCGALLTNSCGDVWFCEDTGLTITVGDCEGTSTAQVWMEGFGNTIFGYAYGPSEESVDALTTQGEGQYGVKIPVFIITIDPDTKELTYVQLHQINNDNRWDPNEANDGGDESCHVLEQINIGLAVTDFDHDSIWTPVHVTILDDGPKVVCEPREVSVDEDFLPKGNHDFDGGPGAHGDDQGSTCATGNVHVDFGRDQPGSFCLDKLTVIDDKGNVLFDHCTNNLFTSKGEPISVEFHGDQVIGTACGQPAFTLTIDCNGCFKFELFQALEHPFHDSDSQNDGPEKNWEDNLHFDFGVKATDCDGDSVRTEIKVNVDDDAPTICDVCYVSIDTGEPEVEVALASQGGTILSHEYGSVDEDFLKAGNHDTDTDPDNLNNPFGDGNNGDGPGGLCVSGQINAKIGADQPGSFLFSIPGLCEPGDHVESSYKTSEGYPITLTLSQDGCNWVITGTYVDGVVVDDPTEDAFTITLDSKTGSFKFELQTALQHPDSNGDHGDDATDDGTNRYEDDLFVKFDVKVVDSDGDSAKTCLVFKVDDDGPVLYGVRIDPPIGQGGDDFAAVGVVSDQLNGVVHVDEDASLDPGNRAPGIEGGPGDDGVGGNVVTGHISFGYGADGPGGFGFDPADQPSGLTSGGEEVLYKSDGANGLIAYIANGPTGEETIFTLTTNETGDFTFTLVRPLDHPGHDDPNQEGTQTSYEDNLLFDLVYTVTDADGDAVKGKLAINVDDDSPEAQQIEQSTPAETQLDTNLLIVLDVSGSMGSDSGLTALNRLNAARAAVNELFEQYDNLGDVAVKIVAFSSGAGEQPGGWHTIAEAKAFLDGLSAGGSTNYAAALQQAANAFGESGKIVDGQNVLYFVSDGKPNPASTGLDAGEQAIWENFVSSNHIVSNAIGIGTGVSATELDPIAYDGVHNTQIPSIIVTDLNDLSAALVGTLPGVVVSGELDGSPSKFGADGGFVKSVTVDGTTYNFDRALNTVTPAGVNHGTFDATTHILSVATGLDGVLAINLEHGSYEYHRSTDPNDHGVENVTYVLSDNDGDAVDCSLTITVPAFDLPPIARDDHIITNAVDPALTTTINVSDAALLWNDTDANGDSLSVLNVFNPTGLTAVHGVGNTVVVDQTLFISGSFDYTASDGSAPDDTAHVTVSQANVLVSTLKGDGLDNILIDRDNLLFTDTLRGFEGKDVLIGGAGNNIMVGGRDDDLIDLSKGGNDVVRIDDKLDGNDVVLGFNTTSGSDHDQVNLDALFDGYGPMSGTRADHVTTSDAGGGDSHINIDLNDNVGDGFEMVITLKGVAVANIDVGVSGSANEVILGS